MKVKIAVGVVVLAVILYFSFSSQEAKDQQASDNISVETEHETHDGEALGSSSPTAETSLQNANEATEKLSPMEKLLKKVNGLSMFNQKGLNELREEAYKWMEEHPKEFEDFTLKQVQDADKNTVESIFFFVEAYAKKHPNAGEGVNEILKMDSKGKDVAPGHGQMGEKQKQNMTKAFAMEVYFDRLEDGSDISSDGVDKLEGTIKGLVEKESDLMMVRQGLLVLRNYLDYEREQLQEIIDSRGKGNSESHSYSDLLKKDVSE